MIKSLLICLLLLNYPLTWTQAAKEEELIENAANLVERMHRSKLLKDKIIPNIMLEYYSKFNRSSIYLNGYAGNTLRYVKGYKGIFELFNNKYIEYSIYLYIFQI